jgi:hypothetical protein
VNETDSPDPPPGVDLDHPNSARVYDYLLGGTSNWAIDRALGDAATAQAPLVKGMAWTNREFLRRAVHYCARTGFSQFLDIGSGVPTVGNVHEVADQVNPDSRCVYVDNEPVAVAHSQVLLERHGDLNRHAAIRGDFRDVEGVWGQALATGVLDARRPIVLLMVSLLHFLPDLAGVNAALARYRRYLPVGSALVLTHGTEEGVPEAQLAELVRAQELYGASGTKVSSRTRAEILAFFGDFTLVEPGLVWLPEWRLDEAPSRKTARLAANPARACMLGGVALKKK